MPDLWQLICEKSGQTYVPWIAECDFFFGTNCSFCTLRQRMWHMWRLITVILSEWPTGKSCQRRSDVPWWFFEVCLIPLQADLNSRDLNFQKILRCSNHVPNTIKTVWLFDDSPKTFLKPGETPEQFDTEDTGGRVHIVEMWGSCSLTTHDTSNPYNMKKNWWNNHFVSVVADSCPFIQSSRLSCAF